MKIDFKCVPYINTYGSEEYKNLVSKGFNQSFIAYPSNFDHVLFDGWQVKDKGNYKAYTNVYNNKYMIEYYEVGYTIITSAGSNYFPIHAQTIDQFISDCNRCGLELFWH